MNKNSKAAWLVLAAALPLASCGGKAVSSAEPTQSGQAGSGTGGGTNVGGSPATGGTAGQGGYAGSQASGGTGGMGGMAGSGAAAGSGGSAPWNHQCVCKTWTDDNYPPEFLGQQSCVNDGTTYCKPGQVCCALSCVSPNICIFDPFGFEDVPPDACSVTTYPNDFEHQCCIKYTVSPSVCTAPEDCAPDGVIKVRKATPNDTAKKCWHTPPLPGW